METPAWIAVRILSTLIGIAIVILAYFWAMQVLMVRRAKPPLLARLVFYLGLRRYESGNLVVARG